MRLKKLYRLIKIYGTQCKSLFIDKQQAVKEIPQLESSLAEEQKLDHLLDMVKQEISLSEDFLSRLHNIPERIIQISFTKRYIQYAFAASIFLAVIGFLLGHIVYLEPETITITEEWFWQFSDSEISLAW